MASIQSFIEDPVATVADLRAFTQQSGGRTLLRWDRLWGTHDHKEALVLCVTGEQDIEAMLQYVAKRWGEHVNVASDKR